MPSSNAIASAELDQSATQTNSDSKTIDRAAGDAENPVQPVAVAVQLEGVLQANVDIQDGEASAEAYSGDVQVQSFDKIKAGLEGIIAESNAVATADVDQSADQENTNDVTATAPAVIQGQLVGQLNVNVQDGDVEAEAYSGDVEVQQSGALTSGADGITAESNAISTATLEQSADQDNSNSASGNLLVPTRTVRGADRGRERLPGRAASSRKAGADQDRRSWPAGSAGWAAQCQRAARRS